MTTTDFNHDPRPQLALALDQVEQQIDVLGPGDADRPTPCTEYDVRKLIAHLVAVLRKLEVVRHGGDMTQVTDPADDLVGDEGTEFRHARSALEQAWEADSSLGPVYTLAWGTMAGHDLLEAYIHEFTVHAWDLAQVTGRGADLDPGLAEAALDWYASNVPEEDRSEDGPFGPAVAVADDAAPYTRLAAFVGRQA